MLTFKFPTAKFPGERVGKMTIVINETGLSATRPRSRVTTVAALAGAALAFAWACMTGPGDDGHDATRLAILDSQVEHVLGPTMEEFETAAIALKDATAAWSSAAVAGGDVVAARETAQTAWRDAMLVWQRAEMLQVGPAGSSAFVVGGQDQRDQIYSWPTVNGCRIDEETVAQSYDVADFFTSSLVNVRGLDALEYLLWADPTMNACAATEPLNQAGSWAALEVEELERRRADYAAAAAAEVARLASELALTWRPDAGEFAVWITAPGEAGSPYGDPTEALDELFGAAGYADTVLKDRKLAASSVTTTESPWSLESKAHVRANLDGLQQLIWGGKSASEGTGFDDLLIELGEAELADELNLAIADAIAGVEAVEGSFEAAVTADPAALTAIQSAVQKIVDLLKGRVSIALGLRSPGEAAGDAD